MGAEPQRVHVVFLPLMAAGHMIPVLDMAKLFASHHVKTTIITTPLNAPSFTKPLQTNKNVGPPIDIEIIPFPSKEAGLPEGLENFDKFTSDGMAIKFLKAAELMQESLEQVLRKYKPSCLVVDMLLPFATDVAAKLNVPSLLFHGTNCFALCVENVIARYEPQKSVSSDDEEFIVPHLPHEIKLTKSRLFESKKGKESEEVIDEWLKLLGRSLEADAKSYGVVVNSFYELEPDYADYYVNVLGRRAWHIGPVSLCNRENDAKLLRGKDSCIDEHECLRWLDSKRPNSVVYVCFGSLSEVSNSTLHEIAKALEASEQNFIWVVSSNNKNGENWLPLGFEKRTEGKGLIIRGWAPQVMILDHEALGAFVTHCGWNSTLEGISCGVPMVTWPVCAEQFYNEKLVTQILKTGIAVGAKEWNRMVDSKLTYDDIKQVITRVMVGKEALEIRSRAKKLKEMARKAVEFGGSSHNSIESLTQELSSIKVSN